MKKKKIHPLVFALKNQQREIQNQYRNCISKPPKEQYDMRGVWIKVQCGCGADYKTPFHIRNDGKCRECGKSVFKFQKVKDE